MITHPTQTALQFAASLSRRTDTEAAVRDLADAIRTQIGRATVDLAFVFFSAHHSDKAGLIATMLREELPGALCLGCSGEGVIAGPEELETGAALTLWAAAMPGIRLAPLRSAFSHTRDQIQLKGWPDPSMEPGTFVLLADPFTTPMHEVLNVIADRYPNGKAIGGLAGGGHGAGDNRFFLNGEAFDGGLVGVQLTGPLNVRTVISQGCSPIGDRYVVTRADQNMVYELGGRPALRRLQDVFESLETGQRRHAHRALHIGIVIDEHKSRFERGDFLVRNLVGAEQETGALAIGDLVQEGQTIQFHLRDAQSASDDLRLLLAEDRTKHGRPPLGALLFSCCGRGEGLFGDRHHDSRVVQERTGQIPVAGFFAQGEIGPVGGKNFLHGYTASVAIFSEPEGRDQIH